MKDKLRVGEIVKPQGVRGEVKVRPDTDDAGRFLDMDSVYLVSASGEREVTIEDAREREGFAYLMLDGVCTREAAEALRGAVLYVDRAHAVPLGPDENYIADMIGLRAQDTQGRALGTLCDVQSTGSVDVYAFQTPRGVMRMPALRRAIPLVDVARGIIVLDESVLPEISIYDDEPTVSDSYTHED